MIILPAIDIRNGQCVRLTKGDFNVLEKVAEDPVQTALSFEADGAEWLHMVDLDGALEGRKKNSEIFLEVAAACGMNVELGGGIRTMEDIAFYLDGGISRVIIGSAAIRNPELVREAVKRYGEKIAVGIDARDGFVSDSGWTETSDIFYLDLAKRMEAAGVSTIIYTDIGRDGTLQGANLEQLQAINQAVDSQIIASGGIRSMEDIRALEAQGLYGAICGKSVYHGTLSLREAVLYCSKKESEKTGC